MMKSDGDAGLGGILRGYLHEGLADVESGDLTPVSGAEWVARQLDAGRERPVIYADASTMRDAILPGLDAAGIARPRVRLLSAHYGSPLGAHICAPETCGLVLTAMDGTQWTDSARGLGGAPVDASLLAGDFFGAGPAPAPASPQWTEFDMAQLPVLRQGAADRPGGGFWSVHRLQALLKLTGQLAGIPSAAALEVDGVLGPQTAAAIRDTEQHYRRQFPQMIIDAPGQEAAGPQVWAVLLTGSPA